MYIVRGKEDSLVTRNFVPGKTVYNEKLVKVDVRVRVLWGARLPHVLHCAAWRVALPFRLPANNSCASARSDCVCVVMAMMWLVLTTSPGGGWLQDRVPRVEPLPVQTRGCDRRWY